MSITVSITELLQAVGSENIRYQSLSTAMENASLKKGVTVISFATDAISPSDIVMGGGPSGIVLWVDQQLLRERLEELKHGNHVTYGKLIQHRDELFAILRLAATQLDDYAGLLEHHGYGEVCELSDLIGRIKQVTGGAA